MFIRPWLDVLKSRWMPGKRRTPKRWNDKPLQHNVETLEERVVLSAFDLVTVIPNQGVFLSDGAKMYEAPREMTLRFSPGQTIDTTTLGSITVTRAGLDGVINSTDDVAVGLGYVGAGDNPNEVIVRFASALPDDKFQIRIQATGNGALGGNVGDSLIPDANQTFRSFNFELDLGAQVESVVPQPVIRSLPFSVTDSASVSDGDLITINAGPYSYIFEMDLSTAAGVANGHIAVPYTAADTPAQIATKIAAKIGDSLLTSGNLAAVANGEQVEVSGTAFEPTVAFSTTKPDAFAKTVLSIPSPGSMADGQLLKLTLMTGVDVNGNPIYTTKTFEFNNTSVSNLVTAGNTRIDYSTGANAAFLATQVAQAINTYALSIPSLKLKATVVAGTTNIAITNASAFATVGVDASGAPAFSQNFGTLTQAADSVVVYFNQDQLDSASAQNPTFYRLINTATNAVLLPTSVKYQYNSQNGLSAAVLQFGAPLTNASYNLKVGVSAEPNNSLANALNVGTVFTTNAFDVDEYLGDAGGAATVSNDTSDVDLYRFYLNGPGLITLTVTSEAGLSGVVTLLDQNGNVLSGPAATITNYSGLQSSTQPYYARVSSSAGTGGYHLKIESNIVVGSSDDNSSYTTATNLGELGSSGSFLTTQITPQGAFVLMPDQPGGSDEPGHRELPSGAFSGFSAPEVGHGTGTTGGASVPTPTSEQTYSFPVTYGNGLLNQITPEQKEIVRQIFAIFSSQVGIQFREVDSGGNQQIVVGNIQVNAPTLGADQVGGISGSPIIMNAIFFAGDNEFGGGFTSTAFHEIGHNLGLGHSYDVPSVQGSGGNQEAVFTGDNDLIHLLRVLPNNSSDIDLFKFNVTQSGTLSAQTIAERLANTNLLNSVLTLFSEDANGVRKVVARNDDFFSKDSGLEVSLTPGTYYIGVTSTGNDNYDPSISNSGNGGSSRGMYQLDLKFSATPTSAAGLADSTGRLLDGDHDGKSGGEFNTWFTVANTRFVDKLAPAGGTGTIGAPYQKISDALAAAAAGEIVRIVGNGGADRDASTLGDNVPYAIGRDYNLAQTPLSDGSTFQVPKDVTVVIDAGSLIKVRGQTIDVGTSSAGIDRSHGSLQVLGTPVNNVYFTSWRDDAKGSVDDGTNGTASGADWGGIVFRQDSDSATAGVFLNQVNHATLQYGGGQVSVDGGPLRVYNVIDLETSRPTISNNTISNNADAAISANPDSFKADDGRIGPDIHGNLITQNSTNGLFIRIQTPLGGGFETLNVIARFDDTDITHVIAQNLILNGRPAGSLQNDVSARLMIDPGTIVKLSGARIETGIGTSNLIAEGTAANPIIFTSQQDDRYGAGGTFDLKNDTSTSTAAAGNWAGIFVGQASSASLDHVLLTYAGGTSEISGNTDSFNPLEVLQGRLRVTNSTFENNLGGAASTSRGGRGGNDSSTIFVRGAQPIIVDNIFRNNQGNVLSINANSMQSVITPDYGRSTGSASSYTQFDDNYGPLVRLNKFANSSNFALGSTLGMNIRSEELTIESIWDDTDIAHVVRGAITSSEFHTYGGLTLQSSSTGSLVVKLQGANAGFVATGDPLDITDRIGGSVQVIGQPGFPVILTSLKDDTVSAGFKPDGKPQFDTNGDNNNPLLPASVGSPGDWNSISFDQYSNDRNVALVLESEPGVNGGNDINSTVGNPQPLGNLAPNQNSGDENRRLGFEVHGFISTDSPGDVDVYSFNATAGTEVWIDTDFTSQRLDVMVELLDSAGNVLARSLNSQDEGLNEANTTAWLTSGNAGSLAAGASYQNSVLNPLTKDSTLGVDFYTTNFHDAGFRAVLPGTVGQQITYFVRVRSQPTANPTVIPTPSDPDYKTLTSGAYQLQVRLKQVDEVPGSTVRYADIRYATNGIVLTGLPAHSPLMGEAAEQTGDNNSPNGGQYVGPLLQTDRNTLSVAGSLSSSTDVDFFSFTVDYSQIQVVIPGPKFFPTVFDIDWADGLTRPDTVIAVYNANRDLIYIGRESDIADDQPAPGQGQDLDDLSRGSLGKLDAFIGSVQLPAGVNGVSETGGVIPGPPSTELQTYYVAVFSNGQMPTALSASFTSAASPETQRVRLEPINSIQRVVEDHIGFTGYASQGSNIAPTSGPMFNLSDSISLQANIRAFTLSDVNLFVTNSSSLFVVDPFNGTTEINYDNYGNQTYLDIDMRSDGRLYAVRSTPGDSRPGALVELNTGNGTEISAASDGITDVDGDVNTQRFQNNNAASTALAFRRVGVASYDYVYYATQDSDDYPSTPALLGVSKLYRGNAATGSAAWTAGNFGATGIVTDALGTVTTQTTGLQFLGGTLWGISAGNQLYPISQQGSIGNDAGTNVGNPSSAANPNADPAVTPRLINGTIFDYTGLLPSGSGTFAGLTDAPQNVENEQYADLLFVITTTGRIFAIDPSAANAAASLMTVFDRTGNDNIADSIYIDTGVSNPTGLAFSPADFNLWHATERRSSDLGHGVNTTSGLAANPSVDNSRVPSAELVNSAIGNESLDSNEGSGGASMYFGLEEYASGSSNNYYQYDSGGQYGVLDFRSHEDLAANAAIGNNYNVPGGASGSLVTNAFNLEGYTTGDKPTLYFNYWLQTEGAQGKTANSMRDAARVYVSVDNGLTWDLIATNNSTRSAADLADAELPAFASASKSASPKPNQQVQELFDSAAWRQARVDLGDYVGNAQVKLRFDFSTSGRSGSVIDRTTGQLVPSDDTSDPTYVGDEGDSNGVSAGGSNSPLAAQNNAFEGFYIDDIIVGFAGRGEMVTASAGQGSTFVSTPTDPDPAATPPLLTGSYQLEIRRGEQYGSLVDPPTPNGFVTINPTLDINDRQTNGQTVMVGNTTQDGNTVRVYDGLITRIFEFDTNGSTTGTNIPVDIAGLNSASDRGAIAGALATQINLEFAGRNTVIANAVGPTVNSDRVDIFGAVEVSAVGTPPTTTNLGSESESSFPSYGNDYPDTLVANSLGGFASGTPGFYSLTGTLGNSQITGNADVDFFRTDLSSGDSITVDLTASAITGTNYVLVLVDSGFNLLAAASNRQLAYTAPAAGTFFVGIFGDDGTLATPVFNLLFGGPTDSLASTGNDTFDYSLVLSVQAAGTTLPTPLSVDSYVRQGDDNRERQQGQIIIENNQILNVATTGILVDDDDRFGTVPHPGAALNTPVPNTARLITGMYLQNNTIARFGTSGITISGDPNVGLGAAIVPFVKIVNNTIYGGDTSNPVGNTFGVQIQNNASPTLLNNAIVNTGTAISLDVSSSSTEVDANLFQGNRLAPVTGNNALVNAAASSDLLFVNAVRDNYYPRLGSPLVDSSRSTFNDRSAYTSVAGALSIPPSPIQAPLYDRFGQLRVDDPQPGPANQPGLGQNPFQDRGSVERADNTGGVVIPAAPQDNDGGGVDLDPNATYIWIDAATAAAPFSIVTDFTLQLIDSGIGIDDLSVDASDFLVLKNGVPLIEGTDYFFTYNQNTNECIFTSVSTFELDNRYQIVLDGQGITDLAGNALQNNQAAPFSSINPNVAAPFDSSLLYFTYIVTDGQNTPPVNTAPAAVSLNEDSSIAFTGANTISVTDADAFLASDGDPTMSSDGGRIHVSLSVPDGFGTLTLGSTLVLTQNGGAATGTGSATDPLLIDGRITDINAVLAGLIFTPPADFPPTVQPAIPLTIATSDLGKFGTPAVANVTTTIVNITVNPVNDRPAFLKGADRNDQEGDPAVVNAAWATGISTGAANETTQTVQFEVTANTNTSLFSVLPTINAAGQLSYTLDPDAFGFADITVVIKDDGGTANGGVDTSAPQTFRINVAPLNDAPSFTKGADENVNEDAGVRTVPAWATAIQAGPANESAQVLTFLITGNTNPSLFAVGPTISSNGTLSYELAPNANGFADITVTLKDNGGTANAGDVDTSAPQTFRINVDPLNDAPTFTKGANQAVLGDVLFNSVPGWATNITAGPSDEAGQTVQFVITGNSDPSLFTVQPEIAPDGTLTYTLSPTADGEATITFHLEDNGATGSGNVNSSADDTFKIRVTVNDAPSFALAGTETQSNEDSGLRTVANWATSISAGPPDEVVQILTFLVTNNTNPALFSVAPAISSTGTLTYTLAANANGFADVTVVLKDDGGTHFGVDTSAPQTFRITANALNDAPSFTKGADQSVFETDTPQVVPNWATNLSAGPTDESGQTLSFNVVGNTNPGLFLVAPAIAANGTLTYTLAHNAVGSAAIRINLADNGSFGNGNVNVSADQTFNIVVTGVNDAPSFVKGSDQSVTETFSLQTVTGWATSISAGPANEGSQTVSFIVTGNTNPGLFAVAPSISPNGTLTYQIQQYTPGIATITVKLQDSGGTANGGVDTSTEQTFVIESIVIYDAPTDIGLSGPKTVTENLPAGTVVGTLTSVDPDIPAGTFTYSLVTGAGSSGNDAFIISGDQLLTNQSFNFEAQSSYSIRIRTTDNTSRTFDKIFTIQILDVNEAATMINTSANPATGVPNSILENRPTNTIVGTLLTDDVDIGDVTTFTLVAGAGSTDNSLFFISGNTLIAKPSFNYEAKSSYTVRIRAVDSRNAAFETPLTISVFNVNEAPTNINLSGNTIVENSAIGTPIGDFSTIDPDAGDTFTYSLVSGTGSADNGKFEIVNGQLQVAIPPDYEYPGHFYTIRVRATDAGNDGSSLSFEKTFTISILNVNEAPTGLTLVDQSVEENKPIGTVVGTLGTVDPDVPDIFAYALVSGDGADDNNLFSISGDKLVTATTFDFETRSAYSVRIRTTDSSGHQFENSFAITITDGKDAPIISLAPSPISTRVRKPILIDPAAQITDRDSDVFDGGKLVVKIYSGEQPGDALRIMKGSFNGLTLKAVRGNTVLKLGKQEIATISGGSDFIPLTITFHGNVSTELFQKVMQSITLKARPYPAPRVISMQAYDETGLASNIAMRSIEVT